MHAGAGTPDADGRGPSLVRQRVGLSHLLEEMPTLAHAGKWLLRSHVEIRFVRADAPLLIDASPRHACMTLLYERSANSPYISQVFKPYGTREYT